MNQRLQRVQELSEVIERRIVVLDGAMGTMIQACRLQEADYRGERFRDWHKELKGANDLLTLTQPAVIATIHRDFLQAGADIIATNTFNSNSISMADYGLEAIVPELNWEAARLARSVADEISAATGQTRFVAGALGPTSRTASLSPDVQDPAYRSVRFDDLVSTYSAATQALIKVASISC